MSARVDVLAVMDSAKHVAVLCDPLVRSTRHPASNSLEALAFNLRGEIDEARVAVAELIEAAQAVENSCVRHDANDADLFQRLDAAIARVKGGAA